MGYFEAVLLGVIQGITEFLPISSTAHLTIAGRLMGLVRADVPGDWTATIAIMQLGTAGSILLYFRTELWSMARALTADLGEFGRARREGFRPDSRLAFLIAVGTVPIVLLGLLLKRVIEGGLTKDMSVIGWSLIGLALVLWWAERRGNRTRALETKNVRDAILVGLAQAVALVPGASRAGTTITAGLFLGFTREAAARFSFLLSIPAVMASGLYQLYEFRAHLTDANTAALLLSVVTGGVTGYLAIAFLLRYLRNHSTMIFIFYRIALGAALLIFLR